VLPTQLPCRLPSASGVPGASAPPLTSGRSAGRKRRNTPMNSRDYEALPSLLGQREAGLLVQETAPRQPAASPSLIRRTQLLSATLEETRSSAESQSNWKRSMDRRDRLPRERWRTWLARLATRRRPLPRARSDEYSAARAHAIKWLGDRYLLARPIKRRDSSRT
jgi:hypothetical protein